MQDYLNNLKVLSLEHALTAPYLTYRLAQDGLQIIRIENRERPDPNRYIGIKCLDEEGMSSYYLAVNSGKKGITLNLSTTEGQELLKKIISKADIDIFITNQLPKNYNRLGIDYKTLSGVKKDLIWVGVTGFGSDEMAYDPILQARGGLMELTGSSNGNPLVFGIPLPDMGTSIHIYSLIMKSLIKRETTGNGSKIDFSMFQSTVSWLTVPVCLSSTFDIKDSRNGNTHKFFAPASVYQTKDGFVYIAVGSERQWKSLVTVPGFESLAVEKYMVNEGRISSVDTFNKEFNNITRNIPTNELIESFLKAGVAISKISSMHDLIEDPLVKNRLLFSEDEESGLELSHGPPPVMTAYLESQQRKMSFPPRLGEHNKDIFCGILGMTSENLKILKNKGIV